MLSWIGRCLYRFLVSQLASEPVSRFNWQTGKQANRRTNRGSILIIVLWSLFFLSALAVAINSYIFPQLSLAGKLRDRAKMYYLAKAGTKRAILEIEKDATDSYDALKEPWSNNEDGFKEIKLGDGVFSIVSGLASEPVSGFNPQTGSPANPQTKYGLVDEERKINLNKSSYAVLKQFFEIAGRCSSQQAAVVAASIIDWRDSDDEPQENGAESGYYLNLQLPYPCKNKDFEVIEELLLVKGMTQGILDKVKDRITLYGQGTVNINTADELVLKSLGMSESLAGKVTHFRNGSDGKEATSDDNVFENVGAIAQDLASAENLSQEELSQLNSVLGAGFISVRSDNFRGESFGGFAGRDVSQKIVFIFNRNKTMKYWRQE